MCMNFNFTRREVAVFLTGVVILSPFLLVGYGVYLVGRGAGGVAHAVQLRRINRFWRKMDRAKGGSPLQLLWDQLKTERTHEAMWRVGFALTSLGDLLAARKMFRSVVSPFDEYEQQAPIAGRYFLARAEVLLHQWPAAIEQLRKALPDFADELARADAMKVSVTEADVKGLLAYATFMQASRGAEQSVADIEQALGLANEAAALDPANARHPYVAAWCRFTLGIRTDAEGKTVTFDVGHLYKATELLDRARELAVAAEREAHVAIVAEFGERPTLPAVEGTVVEPTKDVPPEFSAYSDNDDDSVEPPRETLQATATGEGAGGVSIAEILSLQAQAYAALMSPKADAAVAAARAIDPSVPHSGLSMNEGGDPRVGLLAPWPLPLGPNGEAIDGFVHHDFAPTTLVKPTWCDRCMNRIKGFHHGLRCKACGYTVHDEGTCKEQALHHHCYAANVSPVEPGSPGAASAPTHQHVFRVRRVHTTHDCMQCHKFIMLMTRAVECTVCRCFAHLDCAKSVPNSVIDVPANDYENKKYAIGE